MWVWVSLTTSCPGSLLKQKKLYLTKSINMSQYNSLKATIDANIKQNGNQEITGQILNTTLNAMVNSMGAGYQFIGVATPTNPGSAQTPDYKCFYLATSPGTYTNLGGLVVADGEVALLKWDTSWTKEVSGIATAAEVSLLDQNISHLISVKDKVSESTDNIWTHGDVSVTGYQLFPVNGVGGKPLFIRGRVRSDTEEHGVVNIELVFGDGTSQYVGVYNNTDFAFINNSQKKLTGIYLYSASSSGASAGINAVFTDIMVINGGAIPKSFHSDLSAIDVYARDYLEAHSRESQFALSAEISTKRKTLLLSKDDFRFPITIMEQGTFSYISGYDRPSTNYIDVHLFVNKKLSYNLFGLRDGNGNLNVISFFDSDKNYISGIVSYQTGLCVGIVDIPENAYYIIATSEYYNLNNSFIYVINDTADDLFIDSKYSKSTVIVNPEMDKVSFVNAINAYIPTLAMFNKVREYSFIQLDNTWDWDKIYTVINKNLRDDVASIDYTFEYNCQRINYYLAQKIYRFMDAKLNTTNNTDFSRHTGLNGDEPSVIVSDDQSEMMLYAHLKRIKTKDGINWSTPETCVLNGSVNYLMHIGINYIDGVYYLIGTQRNDAGDLFLFTSTDGINFTEAGKLFNAHAIISGETVNDWGNPYLYKEPGSGKFYLFIEYEITGTTWRISLAKCNDIFAQNEDGTIGDWITVASPIIATPWVEIGGGSAGLTPVSAGGIPAGAGNAELAKGVDNQPIKVDGKYYMYFHSTKQKVSNILRAYSYDLENWTVENVILDVRNQPLAGDDTSGNADHCITEFKGRTYMFYSYNINTQLYTPSIEYTIDDRSMRDVLAIRP